MVEPKFKVGDMLYRYGHTPHKVKSIYEDKVYVCEIDDDGPCESDIPVAEQDLWETCEDAVFEKIKKAVTPENVSDELDKAAKEHFQDILKWKTYTGTGVANVDSFKLGALWMLKQMSNNQEKPERSYISREYHVGSKPRFEIGDVIAVYEFYADYEGETVYGTITDIKWDEEEEDWMYYFDNATDEEGSEGGYTERYLLEEEAYRKNNRKK